MKITILGSCRQDSLYGTYNITNIKNFISYPHYTKEMIEVIKFCKFGGIKPEDTLKIFRSPGLNNRPIYFTNDLRDDFESTDIFILEIASRIAYKLGNYYVHHIFYDDEQYNSKTKNLIEVSTLSDDEIEKDIVEIQKLLCKPIIIVSHLVTYNKGSRYELAELLKNICAKHNIPFINPVQEIVQRGHDISKIFVPEAKLAHYNNLGHSIISSIYTEYISKFDKNITNSNK